MGKGNQLSFFSFFFGEKNPPISSVSPCLSRPRLYFFFSLSFFLLFLAWKRCSASTRAACSSGNGGRAALVLGSQSRGFGRLANAARGIEAADLSHRLGIFRQEKDRCVSEGDASRRLAGVRHSLELLKCAHIHRGALTILLWISSATLKLRVWRCCPRSPLRVWRCCPRSPHTSCRFLVARRRAVLRTRAVAQRPGLRGRRGPSNNRVMWGPRYFWRERGVTEGDGPAPLLLDRGRSPLRRQENTTQGMRT